MPAFLLAAAAILGLFLPQWLGGAATSALVVIAIFAIMAYGLDIVLSDLGEVSLAHTVFFATGAYATGLLATRTGFGAWGTLLGAMLAAAVIALLLGLLTLRLREFVFSLVTYAAAVVAAAVAHNWNFLGGSDGIVGIPTFDLSLGPLVLVARNDAELWPYAYAALLLVLWFVARFRRSRLGLVAVMAHLNPRLATMSGVDIARTRLAVFVLSAPVTALAGWLYAYQRAYVGPDLFESYFLVLMLTAVVLVGKRLLPGPLLGMALVLGQEKFLSFGGDVDAIILGLALILVLCFVPGGLVGAIRPLLRRLRPAPTH
ncbi:branched-chain amino acid ABC transporter permease [Roseicella aquatilis]|uniref:Branched-chain amino acid ABC transporter permease n=1 Tax=Roseicella aquatilis TaxID=2527868 RepID=A0A4V2WM42_9PROT|nr:branched-chain amino acid ABC transporter permease [Roseicella aquatilis]TCZ65477.1 branched-chain amino acid ABC transporter permease [Roseicella aquatilis]